MPSDTLPSPRRLASSIVKESKVRHSRFILCFGSILVLPPRNVPAFEPPEHPAVPALSGNKLRRFNSVGVADDPARVRFNAELLLVAFHVIPL